MFPQKKKKKKKEKKDQSIRNFRMKDITKTYQITV